jgi:hypothetical protein
VLSEPDVARVSNESEAFVLIEEDSIEEIVDEEMEPTSPVQEEVFSTKVTSEESSVSPSAETEPQLNGVSEERKIERKRSTTNINLTQGEMENNKENDPSQGLTRGGSKRLDLSKYQGGGGEGENKRASVTRRLDTSRFSKFQGDSPDSGASTRVTRNFTIGSANRKSGFQKPPVVVGTNNSICAVCKKTVYSMERITADGNSYHKNCFRCAECHRTLSLGNFAQSKQYFYCKPHFKQLFQLKGNYDDAFKGSSRSIRSTPSADTGTHKN